ncbi:hypothetical protein A2U01_0030421, partial [Trifolium medium]|nr:hypothetical protein [Trifolium medium]
MSPSKKLSMKKLLKVKRGQKDKARMMRYHCLACEADAATEENASHIAPLKKKQRTKRGKAVKQASADVSASAVPEPTASAIEKNDQDEEAEVSKPAPKKRKIKVHTEGTRKSSRRQAKV